MGFLKEESLRLRRKRGWTADELSDEIFAIFNADVPFTTDQPITITNKTPQPGLTIKQNGPYDGSIKITRYPDGPINLPGLPPFLPPGLGDYTITIIFPDGTPLTFPPGGPQDKGNGNPPPSKGGGGGFPGKILSGTGDTYQVEVYEDGVSGEATTRSVTQLSISASEKIEANTWVFVGKTGDDYFMQHPVWG